MKKRQIGFTLAEILITLGIIGIVASMTIPTILQNAQDTQFHSGWKKAYSEIAQAQQHVLMDNGGTNKDICSDFDDNCLRDNFVKYLKILKQCDSGQSMGACWATNSYSTENFAGAILADGAFLMFRYEKSACDYTEVGDVTPRCGWIRVDVNGFKPPNTMGKDLYTIRILSNKIYPANKENADNCATDPTDESCSAYFLYH